jgi:hypothetical protein
MEQSSDSRNMQQQAHVYRKISNAVPEYLRETLRLARSLFDGLGQDLEEDALRGRRGWQAELNHDAVEERPVRVTSLEVFLVVRCRRRRIRSQTRERPENISRVVVKRTWTLAYVASTTAST